MSGRMRSRWRSARSVEVPQTDGVLEEPTQPSGADQQPCGADQSDVPVPGEGAVQVEAPADTGPVRGVDAGWDLEGMDPGRDKEDRSVENSPVRQDTKP